ncbi:MAG: outer membrane beta-barrel protein, partial [Aliarcobacter sp.]
QFNDWFSLCSRGEYLGSNNSSAFGNQGANQTTNNGNTHVTGNNLWEYTLTAGFNVIDNLLIRAEYRMDWGSNSNSTGTETTPNGNNNGSVSGGPAYYAGAEVVYSF